MVFSATFNINISVISRRSVFLVEETGVPGENHDLYIDIDVLTLFIFHWISRILNKLTSFPLYCCFWWGFFNTPSTDNVLQLWIPPLILIMIAIWISILSPCFSFSCIYVSFFSKLLYSKLKDEMHTKVKEYMSIVNSLCCHFYVICINYGHSHFHNDQSGVTWWVYVLNNTEWELAVSFLHLNTKAYCLCLCAMYLCYFLF